MREAPPRSAVSLLEINRQCLRKHKMGGGKAWVSMHTGQCRLCECSIDSES